MSKKDVVVGLDIGTTKVCCMVGEASHDGSLEIVGIGTAPSTGLRKGVVVHIESTVESITKAVEEAELMAGLEISTVTAGIAGGHIQSFNSSGSVTIKDREITHQDVQRAIDAAKALDIPLDREVIHIIPQEYVIDGEDGIRDPIGMSGARLEVKVHIVTGAVSSAQNIVKCANLAGLNVSEICLEPIASSDAVLHGDEKELGVILVDIGGGTTDVAIFREGAVVYTGVLAIGGNHITNDISVGLRTPQHEAELLKIQYGCALASLAREDDMLDVAGVGGRKARLISRRQLAEIIEPRVEEMFLLIQREISKSGMIELLAGGLVLTGGASMLEGMSELAEYTFSLPVKRGVPLDIGGLHDVVQSPKYATGVGLLRYAARNSARARFPIRERNIYDKIKGSMRTWIRDLF